MNEQDLRAENERLRAALRKIEAWEMPPTKDGKSYAYHWGCNGEREVIVALASAALEAPAIKVGDRVRTTQWPVGLGTVTMVCPEAPEGRAGFNIAPDDRPGDVMFFHAHAVEPVDAPGAQRAQSDREEYDAISNRHPTWASDSVREEMRARRRPHPHDVGCRCDWCMDAPCETCGGPVPCIRHDKTRIGERPRRGEPPDCCEWRDEYKLVSAKLDAELARNIHPQEHDFVPGDESTGWGNQCAQPVFEGGARRHCGYPCDAHRTANRAAPGAQRAQSEPALPEGWRDGTHRTHSHRTAYGYLEHAVECALAEPVRIMGPCEDETRRALGAQSDESTADAAARVVRELAASLSITGIGACHRMLDQDRVLVGGSLPERVEELIRIAGALRATERRLATELQRERAEHVRTRRDLDEATDFDVPVAGWGPRFYEPGYAAPKVRDESAPPPGWERDVDGEYEAFHRSDMVATVAEAWAQYDAEHGYAPSVAAPKVRDESVHPGLDTPSGWQRTAVELGGMVRSLNAQVVALQERVRELEAREAERGQTQPDCRGCGTGRGVCNRHALDALREQLAAVTRERDDLLKYEAEYQRMLAAARKRIAELEDQLSAEIRDWALG